MSRRRMADMKRSVAITLSLMLVFAFGIALVPDVAKAATNYYVDTNGNDNNDGMSLSTPFKTIQKAASLALAGDTVYIRGGTYRETVAPVNSGTAGSPITFQAYQGENVVVSGLELVHTSWTQYSGNIYYTNYTMNLGDQNDLFVDGNRMVYARWPNKTGANPMTNDGAPIASGSLTSITDPNMPNQTPGFYDGAIVWSISAAKWTAWGATITGSGGGTINFTIPGDMGDSLNPGDSSRGDSNYYYLAGKLELLDAAKEWFYDSNTSRLYLYAPAGDNPGGHTVEVKARVQAIDLTGKSYINIKGVNITGAEMKITGDHNLVDGMTATYIFSHNGRGLYHTHPVTDDGIHITGSYNTIQNGNFGYSDGNIFLIDAGSDNVITHNYIHDGDLNGCYDALIRLENNYNDRNWTTITYNTMYNTGRSAIHFIRPAHFEHNEVSHTNIVGDDGGPIYLGSDLKGPDGTNSTVAYNIVHDIYWQSGKRTGVVPGIYMDGGTYNATAHHNVLYNIGQDGAFRMNGPSSGTYLYNNTSYNTPSLLVSSCCGPTYSQDNNFHNQDASNFVDAANHNFHLVVGSSAIDAGSVYSPWTDGYVGSAPDLGAYEYGGADWTAGVLGGSSDGSTGSSSGTYEAEAAGNTLAGGAAAAACGACSGGFEVGNVGNNSGTLQFNNVKTGSTGTYKLTISYVNGEASARTALMSVNGGAGTGVTFPSTGDWSTTGTVTISVPLNAGSNTIKFYTDAAGVWAPNFDKISLSGGSSGGSTGSSSASYEAEAAGNTVAGGAAVVACGTCSGGFDVGNVGNNSGTLQFNNVKADSDGAFNLTVYYVNGEAAARTALMSINGGAGMSVTFPSTGSWSSPGSVTVSVPLNAGNNTIMFYTDAAGVWAPDFDKISVVSAAPQAAAYEAEATGNMLAGGAAVAACSVCSGGHAVGNVGNNSGTLQFNSVNADSAGTYNLTVYYVNGDAGARSALMSVNGGAGTSVTFPSTGTWTGTLNVGKVTVSIHLNAGSNTIRFYTDAAGVWAPNFDKISIASAAPQAATFEAEAAGNTLAGGAAIAACGSCSGGYEVGYVGNNSGTLQFNNVNADSAGTYTLTIYYLNGDAGARTALMSVNGGAGTSVAFPSTGKWTGTVTIGTVTISVLLNAGHNSIKFYTDAPGVWAPNFDRITVAGGAPTNEAEAAGNTLAGGAAIAACSNCSGGYKVGYVGSNSGTLQFNNINAAAAGIYSLTIYYLNGDAGARTSFLSVNGGSGMRVSFPSTGIWTGKVDVGTVTVNVPLKAGSNAVKFYTDEYGIWAPDFDKISVAYNTTPPVTAALLSPAQPDGQHGWYTHPVTVGLSVQDDPASVAETVYSLDNGTTWNAYTAPVTLNKDGSYVISYRSTFNAGYSETAKSLSFNLDQTPPVITVAAPTAGSYSDAEDLVPQFVVTDALSGADNTQTVAMLDGRTVQQGTAIPLYTLPLGSHTFTIQASDLAGNAENVNVIFQTTASIDSLQALVARFAHNGKIDNDGIANSLSQKLNHGSLDAFVQEVQAQSGKHVAAAEAEILIRDAKAIMDASK